MQILASPCPPFLARNTILASALTAKEKPPAGCQKVPSSRHGARLQGRVHGSVLNFVPRDCEAEARPADETAEAQRKRGAACGRNSRAGVGAAVQIYERATTRDGNLANSNKRGSGLPFASPLRRVQQKQGTATTRGKEFLSRVCGQKWVPPEAWRFCDTRTGSKACPFLPAWVEFPPRSPRLTDCQPWLLAKCRAF